MKKFIKEEKWELVFASLYVIVGLLYLPLREYEKAFLWSFIGFLLIVMNYSLWSHGKTIKLLTNYMEDVKGFTESSDHAMESYDQIILAVDPNNPDHVREMQNTVKKSRILREEMRKEVSKYVHEQRTNSASMSRG